MAQSLKAVDILGFQDTYSLFLEAQDNPNSPRIELKADKPHGLAPLRVAFDVRVSSQASAAKYEWDFEGDGVYEYKSNSGNAVVTYSRGGAYIATLKVTDFAALSSIKEMLIQVEPNPNEPNVMLSADKTVAAAPAMITLEAANLNNKPIIRYEWDFDGDGVYERSTTSAFNSVTHLYGRAGTYKPKVKVTTKEGLSAVAEAVLRIKPAPWYRSISWLKLFDFIEEAYAADDEEGDDGGGRRSESDSTPVAEFNVDKREGEAPLKIEFTNLSEGDIVSASWDFDGDGLYERITRRKRNVAYLYQEPGYYLVTLRVKDRAGLSDQSSQQIAVTALSAKDTKPLVIIEPKDSQVVRGKVNLGVTIDARALPLKVKYQYRTEQDDKNSWEDIETEDEEDASEDGDAAAQYAAWDTAKLADGAYLVRAVSEERFSSDYISVTINNNDKILEPDSEGRETSDNEYQKETKIDVSLDNQVKLYDRTGVGIPSEGLANDDRISVTIVDPNKIKDKIRGVSLKDLNIYRRIDLESNTSLLDKEFVIRIPYQDDANDGLVDDTEIKEETLNIYTYDEPTEEWVEIFDCVVHRDENFVEGKTNHLSLFGLGGLAGAAIGAGGAGGLASGGGIGGGNGGGGCFIATAAYGTELAKEVIALKQFRDRYLLTNKLGKSLVKFYYRHSPKLAEYIQDKPKLKKAVRMILKIVVVSIERLIKS